MTTKTKPKAKPKPAKKSGPGHERMKTQLGSKQMEALRQAVVADQAKARSEVKPTQLPASTPPKKEKKPKNTDARTITVLVTANPHKSGSRRAKWFAKLKTGMTVTDAVKEGVRATYLTRMTTRNIVKLT